MRGELKPAASSLGDQTFISPLAEGDSGRWCLKGSRGDWEDGNEASNDPNGSPHDAPAR